MDTSIIIVGIFVLFVVLWVLGEFIASFYKELSSERILSFDTKVTHDFSVDFSLFIKKEIFLAIDTIRKKNEELAAVGATSKLQEIDYSIYARKIYEYLQQKTELIDPALILQLFHKDVLTERLLSSDQQEVFQEFIKLAARKSSHSVDYLLDIFHNRIQSISGLRSLVFQKKAQLTIDKEMKHAFFEAVKQLEQDKGKVSEINKRVNQQVEQAKNEFEQQSRARESHLIEIIFSAFQLETEVLIGRAFKKPSITYVVFKTFFAFVVIYYSLSTPDYQAIGWLQEFLPDWSSTKMQLLVSGLRTFIVVYFIFFILSSIKSYIQTKHKRRILRRLFSGLISKELLSLKSLRNYINTEYGEEVSDEVLSSLTV